MNLGKLFEFSVERNSNNIAVVDDFQSYTYREIEIEVNRVASSFQKLGIGYRDRVMVLLKNRRQAICVFWATQKLGAVFAPVNFYRSAVDISYCIEDLEPKALIYEGFFDPQMVEFSAETKPIYISLDNNGGDITYKELIKNGSDVFGSVPVDDSDVAIMLYTSGTSGAPKGVPRSHKNEYASTMAHIVQNRYQVFESTLGAMPLYHTMGMRSLLAMFILNGKYVAIADFDSEVALASIEQEHVSSLYLIPAMYHELLNNERFEAFSTSSVRKLGYAGAPMSKRLTKRCYRAFKPDVFLNHYGSTEIYTFSTCTSLDEKPGCAGKPGINQSLRLISLDPFATVDDKVGRNEIGQVIVHMDSSEAFKGYWNRPEVTREVIQDSWYFTGDLGFFDGDGDLFVVGRVDEMVISGVDHVAPLKVEEILCSHPKVLEAAIVGEVNERWGQIVLAFVVAKDNTLTALELDRFCKENTQLSSFERPRRYKFVEKLPKGPTGKLLRTQLMKAEGEGNNE